MEVTDADIARVPARNIRVPRAAFAAVWTAAERDVKTDWYALGVATTCRWLAQATVRDFKGTLAPADAPATGRTAQRAYEELIESEYIAAEKLAVTRPPWVFANRPGWVEGICATLRWAWRRNGPPPLVVDQRTVG